MTNSTFPEAAIVTGGSSGIGRAIAARLSQVGTRVAILDIDVESGLQTTEDLRDSMGKVAFLECDVRSESDIVQSIIKATELVGPITALVNNAGVNAYARVDTMTDSEWNDFFALDLKSAWLCVKHVIPEMRLQGHGSIVNIASIHSAMTREGMFPYAAAKAGLSGLTRTLAVELGPENIRVNSICPGFIRTNPVVAKFQASENPEEEEERIASLHPLRRIGEPEDVASVAAFLLSSETRFVTGASWFVDGGLSCRFAV